MAIFKENGGENVYITNLELKQYIQKTLTGIEQHLTTLKKILIVLPDSFNYLPNIVSSTKIIYEYLKDYATVDIIVGNSCYSTIEKEELFQSLGQEVPFKCLHIHDPHSNTMNIGYISGNDLEEWTGGKFALDINIEINQIIFENYDAILSLGQLIPHEIKGTSSCIENILLGLGGQDIISKASFVDALTDREENLNNEKIPVSKLLDKCFDNFLNSLPLYFILTSMDQDPETGEKILRGFYSGNEKKIFREAFQLSREINIRKIEKPIKKAVIYLDYNEYKSTWQGEIAIYNVKLALEDSAEIIVIAPGINRFGMDQDSDRIIKKYGYVGEEKIIDCIKKDDDLRKNLYTAAHIIKSSSEKKLKITYASPGLTEDEVISVNYNYLDYNEAIERYHPNYLKNGWNKLEDGEEFYFICNPETGLWVNNDKITN